MLVPATILALEVERKYVEDRMLCQSIALVVLKVIKVYRLIYFHIAIKVFHVIKDKIRTYDLGFTLRPRNENKLKIASLYLFHGFRHKYFNKIS